METRNKQQSVSNVSANVKCSGAQDLPQFSGTDTDDIHAFLEECETYFVENATIESHKGRMAARWLDGPAAEWFSELGLHPLWPRMKQLLKGHFANPSIVAGRIMRLFRQRQGSESAETFVTHKVEQFRNLLPTVPEEVQNNIIYDLAGRSLQSAVSLIPKTCDELIAISMRIPADRPVPAPRKIAPVSRQLPQCRYCPERHFHKDCPTLQGNYYRGE